MDNFSPQSTPSPQDRLQILHRVFKVVPSIKDLSTVLEIMMDHLIELLGAERGFIMLMDHVHGGQLQFRTARNFTRRDLYAEEFQVSRSIVFHCYASQTAVRTSNAIQDHRFREAPSVREFGLRSVLCAPLPGMDGPLGVLYADNSAQFEAFTEDDLNFLETFASQAAAALARARLEAEKDRVRELFSRYVAEPVVEQILARPDNALTAQRRRVTVMFCDLRGFSRYSEQVEPDRLLQVLNEHFEAVTETVLEFGGTVLSFLGDGLLAVFGAPIPLEQQEQQALLAAQAMVRTNVESQLRLGVGLATGFAVLGDLGTSRRREYTVLGDVVNIAARLEKLTKRMGEAVLCDEETYRCSGLSSGRSLGEVSLDGRDAPLVVYAP